MRRKRRQDKQREEEESDTCTRIAPNTRIHRTCPHHLDHPRRADYPHHVLITPDLHMHRASPLLSGRDACTVGAVATNVWYTEDQHYVTQALVNAWSTLFFRTPEQGGTLLIGVCVGKESV